LRPQSAGQRIVTGAGAFKVDVYACRILVPALAYERDVDEVYGLPLKDSQLLVLVGRDILEEWHVVYNGAQGSVTVCT
jgi:hypothetical protein